MRSISGGNLAGVGGWLIAGVDRSVTVPSNEKDLTTVSGNGGWQWGIGWLAR